MIIHVDPSDGIAIFQQIVQQVKYKIACGAVEPGEQLPSVRQLAAKLRINPNTVAKAYTELEREGIISTRRGMGCYVADKPVIIEKEERLKIIGALLDRALMEAYHLDIPSREVEQLFQERLQQVRERSGK